MQGDAAAAGQPLPTCEGGETVVWSNGHPLVSKATTIPGGALLFRKDLKHEGRALTAGQKHIVMLDLWVVRRSSPQVLLVTFPAASAAAKAGARAGAGVEAAAEAGPSAAPPAADEGQEENRKRARLLEMSRADCYAVDVALLPRTGPLADLVAMRNEAAVRERQGGRLRRGKRTRRSSHSGS